MQLYILKEKYKLKLEENFIKTRELSRTERLKLRL